MRTQTISISEIGLMGTIGGQLFNQAPNRQPRKAEIIMQKVKEAFRKDAHNDNEYYSLEIAEESVYKYIKAMLMAIPEFVELNLSQKEFDKNVSVDDKSRAKYSFSTRYDKYDSESWYSDFIDLDAFIRNAHNKLLALMEVEQDCFCCKHQGQSKSTLATSDSDICKTCFVNPNLDYRYECSRAPKGEYAFSCKYNCPEHKQICCEECNKQESCATKCDGKSETCGNKTIE